MHLIGRRYKLGEAINTSTSRGVDMLHAYGLCISGLVPSDKGSASYLLQRKGGGNAVVIAVGGAPEALDAHPGTYNVLLAEKKGFIKLAMEHGYVCVCV